MIFFPAIYCNASTSSLQPLYLVVLGLMLWLSVSYLPKYLKWPTMPGKVVHPLSPVVNSTVDPDRETHLYN